MGRGRENQVLSSMLITIVMAAMMLVANMVVTAISYDGILLMRSQS